MLMLTPEQLKIRSGGIGGSEIAAVAGLSPYSSPLDVWQSKMGLVDDVDTFHTRRGKHLEPSLRSWYAEITGHRVEECKTLVHPTHKLVIATPDGIVWRGQSRYAVLEIKAPHWRTAHQWGEPGTDEVPDHYLAQATWEMAVAELGRAEVAALIDGDLAVYHCEWRQNDFDALLECAERFWRDYVLTKTPPPPGASDSAREWLRQRYPRAVRDLVQGGAEAEHLVAELKHAQEIIAEAGTAHAEAKHKLMALIGDHEGIETAVGRVLWRNNKRGTPEWKAIAAEAGATEELIAKHTKEPGPRVFRVSFAKEKQQ